MPAATTKAALLTATEKEWAKLSKLLAQFDETSASKADEDGYSALRIIGHRAAWIDLYFDWCAAAAKGDAPAMPAPGYKWNETAALNAKIYDEQKDWSWAHALAALTAGHRRLVDDIQIASEKALYGAPLAPGLNWTKGRYAEAAGPSHYRSAAKALRKIMR